MTSDKDGETASGFLSRWSRRKQRIARGDIVSEPLHMSPAAVTLPEDTETVPAEAKTERITLADGTEIAVTDLPDPETLTMESDFSVYLNDKVPALLRQAALRRLWRLDPVFSVRDGLAEYDHDYRAMHAAVKDVITNYKVGRGMRDPGPELEDEIEQDAATPDPASATADRPAVESAEPRQDRSARPDHTDAGPMEADVGEGTNETVESAPAPSDAVVSTTVARPRKRTALAARRRLPGSGNT